MAQESHYTEEKGKAICEQLACGVSLLQASKNLGIPYSTAKGWELDIPEHGDNSVRARELGCHAMADECVMIANSPMIGEERTIKADGGIEIKEADMLAHRRLMIDTRMRLIGKWLPRIYGEKQQVEHSGVIGLEALISAAGEE